MENVIIFIVLAAIIFAVGYKVKKSRDRVNTQPPAGTSPERGDRGRK